QRYRFRCHDRRISALRAARATRARRARHAHGRRRSQRRVHRRCRTIHNAAAREPRHKELDMTSWYPLLAVLAASLVCAYLRTGLGRWTIAGFVALFGAAWLGGSSWLAVTITALVFAALTVPLNLPEFRRKKITAPLLGVYQKITPQLSDTERVALEAG